MTKIVSSLLFHQVTLSEKIAGLKAIRSLLHPGGALHIADYGEQKTKYMRLLFKLVQYADGFERTQPNADGILLGLMYRAGFNHPEETRVFQSLTGSISLYQAKIV